MSELAQIKTVLIGSSGTGNAFSSILALRNNWGSSTRIVTMDTNPKNLVTSSLLSDKHYQVPVTENTEFKNSVIKICADENIGTYIPFIDNEIYIAAFLYEQKKLIKNINLQVKSSAIAELCNDKYKTFLWLSENDIVTPECYKLNAPINEKGHLVLKIRKGFGSSVIKLSQSKVRLSSYNPEEYMIQQECENPEITIDVCYDKKRKYFQYICRERVETKCGVCTKARLFHDTTLEKMAFFIADKLDLHSFCFQTMKYKGEWAVTDINARLGAGTGMSVAAGMGFFSAMYAILWDEDPSDFFKPLQKEIFVTRQYSEFVMNY